MISIMISFFIQVKIFLLNEFFIEYFSGGTYLVFHLYLKKSEFYFQYINRKAALGCEKVAKKDIRILCYES